MRTISEMRYGFCAVLLASVLILTAGCSDEGKNAAANNTGRTQTEQPSASAQQNMPACCTPETKALKVNVYYPNNDGTSLVAVSRIVNTEKDDKYTAALKSLLTGTKEKGQTNIIPKKTKLHKVTVADGVATADFSKELSQKSSGGSTGEEMLVGSIVNTLTEFPEVKKVQILIDGTRVETLSGHMDLSEPLVRMTELLK